MVDVEDVEWEEEEEFMEADDASSSLSHKGTNGFTNGEFSHTNGVDIEDEEEYSEEAPDYHMKNPFKVRFNLRKRSPKKIIIEDKEEADYESPLENGDDGHLNLSLNGELAPKIPESKVTPPKKKRKSYPKMNYDVNLLDEALDLVRSENLNVTEASKRYNLPRSTLRRHIMLNSYGPDTTEGGMRAGEPPKYPKLNDNEEPLTAPEEAHLVSCITKMTQCGKYVTSLDVKSMVKHILDQGHRMVFKDRNRPNAGWMEKFRKRHALKGFQTRRPFPLTSKDLTDWHTDVDNYLRTDWNIDPDIFFAPPNLHRIFNIDELPLDLNFSFEMHELGIHPLSKVDNDEIVVLTCVTAAGEVVQPLIVQKGEGGGHEDDIMPLDQTSYGIAFSLSGRMSSDIFIRWLEAFDRELREKQIEKPVVLLLDDVYAHFHLSAFTYASDNDIILLCIPVQEGALMQPVESALNIQIKLAYKEYVNEYYREISEALTMDQFPMIFLRAWESVRDAEGSKSSIRDDFAHFGLCPLNRSKTAWIDQPVIKQEPGPNTNGNSKKVPKARKSVPVKSSAKKSKNETSNASASKKSKTANLVPRVDIYKMDKQSLEDVSLVNGSFPPSPSSSSTSHSFKTPTNLDNYYTEQKFRQEVCDSEYQSRKVKASHTGKPSTSNINAPAQVNISRLLGRESGIIKTLNLIESFVAPDLIPVWKARDASKEGLNDTPYRMWNYVRSLLAEVQSGNIKVGRNRMRDGPSTGGWDGGLDV